MADTSAQRAILFCLKLIWYIKKFSDGNTGRMNHVFPGCIDSVNESDDTIIFMCEAQI